MTGRLHKMSSICVMIFGVIVELEAISRAHAPLKSVLAQSEIHRVHARLRKWPHNFCYGLHDRTQSRAIHGTTMNRHGLEPLCSPWWIRRS